MYWLPSRNVFIKIHTLWKIFSWANKLQYCLLHDKNVDKFINSMSKRMIVLFSSIKKHTSLFIRCPQYYSSMVFSTCVLSHNSDKTNVIVVSVVVVVVSINGILAVIIVINFLVKVKTMYTEIIIRKQMYCASVWKKANTAVLPPGKALVLPCFVYYFAVLFLVGNQRWLF